MIRAFSRSDSAPALLLPLASSPEEAFWNRLIRRVSFCRSTYVSAVHQLDVLHTNQRISPSG